MDSFRAAVLIRPRQPLEILDIRVPRLSNGQLLIKVLYSAVCGSQLSEIQGHRGEDKFLPHLLGHEGVGIVVELGEGVSRFKVGDLVILTWVQQSGLECAPIVLRTMEGKSINAGRVTTFSEFTVVSENRLFRAPAINTITALPLLGCAALTGAGSVFIGEPNEEPILVVGAGGVGIFTLFALMDLGRKEVHVVERDLDRNEFLRHMFPNYEFYKSTTDPRLLEEVNARKGFQKVYESSGALDSLQFAIDATASNGSIVFSSHPPVGSQVYLDPYELIRGKEVRGNWGGGCTDSAIRDKVIDLFVRLDSQLGGLLTEPRRLDEINACLRVAHNNKRHRVLIRNTVDS